MANKTTKKRSSIKSKDTLLWEVLCPTKNQTEKKKGEEKKTKTKLVSCCLVLMSLWLMNPVGNDWKQQSLKGTHVHLTDPHKASTIRNKKKKKTKNQPLRNTRVEVMRLSRKHCKPQIVKRANVWMRRNTFFFFFRCCSPLSCVTICGCDADKYE